VPSRDLRDYREESRPSTPSAHLGAGFIPLGRTSPRERRRSTVRSCRFL
jgi:hypothetical protein